MFHAVQAERSIEPASMRTQFRLMHDYLLLFLYVSWRKELLDTTRGKNWLHYSFILLITFSEEPNPENEENILGQTGLCFNHRATSNIDTDTGLITN